MIKARPQGTFADVYLCVWSVRDLLLKMKYSQTAFREHITHHLCQLGITLDTCRCPRHECFENSHILKNPDENKWPLPGLYRINGLQRDPVVKVIRIFVVLIAMLDIRTAANKAKVRYTFSDVDI